MSFIYEQWMQTSVTGLNKGRNAAGVCDKRLRKENTVSVSNSRVIPEPAVTEQGESDMEIKIIKLDMITLLCLVFPPGSSFYVPSLFRLSFSSAFLSRISC